MSKKGEKQRPRGLTKAEVIDFYTADLRTDYGTCWVWQGYHDKDGYASVRWGSRKVRAHRLAFEAFGGDLLPGMELDHLCSRRDCCNPEHLEQVTHAENVSRGRLGDKHSQPAHCQSGHEMVGDNVYTLPRMYGHDRRLQRRCRACQRQLGVERRASA